MSAVGMRFREVGNDSARAQNTTAIAHAARHCVQIVFLSGPGLSFNPRSLRWFSHELALDDLSKSLGHLGVELSACGIPQRLDGL